MRTFYRGWDGLRKTLGPRSHFLSLTDYFLYGRCLPVVLILSPVVFMSHATDFGCRILHHAKSVFRCGHDVTDDSTLCEQATCPTVPLLSPTSSVDAEPVALSNDVNAFSSHVQKASLRPVWGTR